MDYIVDRVFKVKRIYRVSYKSILYRLVENGLADKDIWRKFNLAFQRKCHKACFREEPMALASSEPVSMNRDMTLPRIDLVS